MKKIGLIGGISWVSTMDYYKLINDGINEKLGGLNFTECIIYSLNFGDVQQKTWTGAYELLLNACRSLQQSGADGIALCANTAHLYADRLTADIQLPFIHIGEETARAVQQRNIKRIGLLGTKFTMEMDFYREKLESFGLKVLIPEPVQTRDYIQETVKEELGSGIIKPETKLRYIQVMNQLVERGAEGIILGCTEIPLLISQEDFSLPVFDTTRIHAAAIVDFMINA
jgi:aspartate racemase